MRRASSCPFCGRLRDHDPGDYYHEKRCEAAMLRRVIKNETDPEELKRLDRRLEMAEFVGD